jgi:hypothetical protein
MSHIQGVITASGLVLEGKALDLGELAQGRRLRDSLNPAELARRDAERRNAGSSGSKNQAIDAARRIGAALEKASRSSDDPSQRGGKPPK